MTETVVTALITGGVTLLVRDIVFSSDPIGE